MYEHLPVRCLVFSLEAYCNILLISIFSKIPDMLQNLNILLYPNALDIFHIIGDVKWYEICLMVVLAYEKYYDVIFFLKHKYASF